MRFRAGISTTQQDDVVKVLGGKATSAFPALRMRVINILEVTSDETVAAYRADPAVASAEFDTVRTADTIPSDPGFSDQWNLAQMHWETARDSVTPNGRSTIAILDTGISSSHPDLGSAVTGGWSAFGTDPLVDVQGHGTAMAGIAAARTGNEAGIAGVDYSGPNLLSVQVLDAWGSGADSDIIEGVVWAADHGADVILMSFSNAAFSPALQAAIDFAWSSGAVLVAATGNDGTSTPTYPAGDAHVMGVAGTERDDARAGSSNYGADTFIAAPSVSIPALTVDGGATSVSGTSAAAAEVAGAAALLRAIDPGAANGVIVGRLARNAVPAGTTSDAGNGRLDLEHAVIDTGTEFVDPVGAPTGGPFVGPFMSPYVTAVDSASALSARVTGDWTAPLTWSNLRTGTITTLTNSATVTGVGTSTLFLTEVKVGDTLYTSGWAVIGTVASIKSNTSLTLNANAARAITGAAFGAGRVPTAADAVTIDINNIVITIPTATAATAGSLSLGVANSSNIVTLTLTDGTSTLAVDGAVTMHQPNTNGRTLSLNVNAGSLTVGGDLNIDAVATSTSTTRVDRITITTGTLTVAGSVIMNAANLASISALQSQIVMSGGAGTLNVGGAFTVNVAGTITPGTAGSTVNFNGSAAQTIPIGVSSVTYNNLTANNTSSAGATLSAAVTSSRVTGNMSVAAGTLDNGGFAVAGASGKSLSVASGAKLRLGGTSAFPTGFTTTLDAASTVEYYGSTQNVAALTYGNLTISTTGTATAISGTTTIRGTFWDRTTYNASNRAHVFNGDFTNDGTFTAGTSTATFSGTGTQTISGATTFYNLVVDKASGGLTTAANATVGATLTLTSGIVTTGVNTLIVTATSAASVSGGSAASFVDGKMRRGLGTSSNAQTFALPVGSGTTYAPISVGVPANSVTVAGTLTGSTTAGNHPSISTSGLNAAQDVNRYWSLASGGSLALGTYTPTFSWAASGDTNGTLVTSALQVKRYASSAWTSTSTYAAGPPPSETATSYSTTFGDYAVGNSTATELSISAITPVSPAAGASFSVTVQAQDALHNASSVTSDTLVTLTRTSGSGTLGGTLTGTILNGTGSVTITGVTYTKSESVQLTATATSGMSLTASTSTFTVVAGTPSRLQVLLPGETAAPGTATGKTGTPTDATAGTAVTDIIVRATDANWNLTTATPTVAITSSDGYATLPANRTLVSGTATFSVTFKTGNGYQDVIATDTAASGALNPGSSTQVTVNAGAATKLQVLMPGESAVPGSATGKTAATPTGQVVGTPVSVTVNAVDANWNVVSLNGSKVHISTGDATAVVPADNTLFSGTRAFPVTFAASGTWTVTATDVSTVPTLTAGLGASTSVSAAAATRLLVLLPGQTSAPGTVSGRAGSATNARAGTAITVTVLSTDAYWNPVTSTRTVALTTSDANTNTNLPSSAALVDGAKDFSLTFKTAGTWTVTATDQAGVGPLTANTSSTIGVGAGDLAGLQVLVGGQTSAPGTALGYTGSPTAVTAGMHVSITVNSVDANWNVVTSGTDANPTITYSSSDGNALLEPPDTLVNGTMTNDATLLTAGTQTITVTPSTGTPATSSGVTVNAGPAARLQVLLPGETAAPGSVSGRSGTPSDLTAAQAFSVTVNATDALWNKVASATPTIVITSSDGHATLPANAALVAGTGTFSVTLVTADRNQTITASDQAATLTAAVSSQAYVRPGAATKLQVLLPGEVADPGTVTGKSAATPSATIVGQRITVTVNAVDANWNVVPTATPTVAITTDQDSSATLPSPAALSAGIGAFFVTFDEARTWLVYANDQAALTPLTQGTSAALVVGASVDRGTASLSPTSVVAGSTANTLTLTFHPPTAGFVSGSAMRVQVPTGWTAPQTSSSTTGGYVTVAGTCPSTSTAISGTGPWTITVTTSADCVAADSVLITYGAPTGQVTAPTHAATATFTTQSRVGGVGNSFLDIGSQPTIDVVPGAANHFHFSVQPTNTSADSTWGVTVMVSDQYHNPLTSETMPVSLAIKNGTGTTGAVLSGQTTLTTSQGVAVFSGLAIRAAGTAYQLDASGGGLAVHASATFNITPGTATRLQVLMPGQSGAPGTVSGNTGSTTDATAGASVVVTVNSTDEYWNIATSSAQVTIATDDRHASCQNGCTTPPWTGALSAGTTTFTVRYPTAGNPSVTATATGLTTDIGTQIDVLPGAAAMLQVLLPGEVADPGSASGKTVATPSAQTAGAQTAAIANAVDANWNIVVTANPTVAVTSTDPNAVGPPPITLVDGSREILVTFRTATASGWTVTAADQASSGPLTAGTSHLVLVNPGALNRVQVLLQMLDGGGAVIVGESQIAAPGTTSGYTNHAPTNVIAGSDVQIIVNATDEYWNVVASATPTVAIATNSPHATCTAGCLVLGTTSPWSASLVSGTATLKAKYTAAGFPTVTVSGSGDASGLTPQTSPQLDIDNGEGVAFQILVPGETADPGSATGRTGTPTPAAAGATSRVIVNAVDAYWNVDVADANSVTGANSLISFQSSTDPLASLQASSENLISGTMDFLVTFRTAGTQTFTIYSAAAVDPAPPWNPAILQNTTATSPAVPVTSTTATRLAFSTQPSGSIHGSVFEAAPQVAVTDDYGNVVGAATDEITLAVTTNTPLTGGVPGVLQGVVSVHAVSGVATFSGLSLLGAGTYYQLTASAAPAAGLAPVDSAPFDVAPRPITVTAVQSTKAYDGDTASAQVPTVTSGIPGVQPAQALVSGDVATFVETFDTPLPGTGKTLTPEGSVTEALGGSNYAITFVPVTNGTITGTTLLVPGAMDLGTANRGDTVTSAVYEVSWVSMETQPTNIVAQMTTPLNDGSLDEGHVIPSTGVVLYTAERVGALDAARIVVADLVNASTGSQDFHVTVDIPLNVATTTYEGTLTFGTVPQ